MAATTDTVGPCTSPAAGVMRNTVGSSISSSGTWKPGTLIALGRVDRPAPGTAATVHRAGTAVGFDRRRMPSLWNPTLTTPKNIVGAEPTKNGEAICAESGKLILWPVENAITNRPFSSGTGPA